MMSLITLSMTDSLRVVSAGGSAVLTPPTTSATWSWTPSTVSPGARRGRRMRGDTLANNVFSYDTAGISYPDNTNIYLELIDFSDLILILVFLKLPSGDK